MYNGCAPPIFKHIQRPSIPATLIQLCSAEGLMAGPRLQFSAGLARAREGLLIFLVSNQLSSVLLSQGEDLQQHVPLPSLSSPPSPSSHHPSQHQPCSASLPAASLPALPSGSQLSSSEQGSRQGREGRTVTRHSRWLLLDSTASGP